MNTSQYWRRFGLRIGVVLIFWVGGSVLQPCVTVKIHGFSDHISAEASGTSVEAALPAPHITHLRIDAGDGLVHPGGRWLRVEQGEDRVLETSLPRRFDVPNLRPAPVGDWYVDFGGEHGEVFSTDLELEPPYTITARFSGRFVTAVKFVLEGEQLLKIGFRTGILDENLLIQDAEGQVLASTHLVPRPITHFLSILSTFLMVLSVAVLLLAVAELTRSAKTRDPQPPEKNGLTRRQVALAVATLVGASILVSVWTSCSVLETLPHTPDGVAYLLSSRWLLDGSACAVAPENADAIPLPFVYLANGRWLPHHPLGWPLVLALGEAFDCGWLVNPLISGLWVAFIFLIGRQIAGPPLGLMAAVFGFISPVARLQFGSHLSHPTSAVLLLAVIWLFFRPPQTGRNSIIYLSLAGFSLGLMAGVRPASALAAAIAIGPFLLTDLFLGRRSPRDLAAFFASSVLAFLPTAWANTIITGHPLTFPYKLANSSMFGAEHLVFGLRNLDAQLAALGANLHGLGWIILPGIATIALGLSFAAVPFISRKATRFDFLLLSVFLTLAAVHLLTRGHGLHGFGPRYLFEAVAPLLLLSARGVLGLWNYNREEESSRLPLASSITVVTLMLLILFSAGSLFPRLRLYSGYNYVDGTLEEAIAERGIRSGIVVFPSDDWYYWGQAARLLGSGTGTEEGLTFRACPPEMLSTYRSSDADLFVWDGEHLYAVPNVVGLDE